eukprot:TRINITY_DN6073_c0_g1_i4.p1 TRINITY_DN6073_c0_g1~~TRINITY_DN6073_c0_g1_i4.p1  ORF type:complete len:564 (-),score=92.50 TRINITY_DN6073_c0_g1_i4:126-1766(-)
MLGSKLSNTEKCFNNTTEFSNGEKTTKSSTSGKIQRIDASDVQALQSIAHLNMVFNYSNLDEDEFRNHLTKYIEEKKPQSNNIQRAKSSRVSSPFFVVEKATGVKVKRTPTRFRPEDSSDEDDYIDVNDEGVTDQIKQICKDDNRFHAAYLKLVDKSSTSLVSKPFHEGIVYDDNVNNYEDFTAPNEKDSSKSSWTITGILIELPNEIIVSVLLNLNPCDLCTLGKVSSFWKEFVKDEILWQYSLPKWLSLKSEEKNTKIWKEKGLKYWWTRQNIQPPSFSFYGLLHHYFPDDPVARQFWKQMFPGVVMEAIDWLTFAQKFYSFVAPQTEPIFTVDELESGKDPRILDNPVPLFDYRCFKAILCREKDEVTIDSFSALLKWFGPLTTTYHYNRQNILTRIRKTVKYSAFHGFISSAEMKRKLQGFPTGTFAIRFSETTPGYFVLARVHADGNVTEGRMYWDNKKGFTVGNYSARTLTRFCRDLRKKLNLQYICGKRSYETLFDLPEVEEGDDLVGGLKNKRQQNRNSVRSSSGQDSNAPVARSHTL